MQLGNTSVVLSHGIHSKNVYDYVVSQLLSEHIERYESPKKKLYV